MDALILSLTPIQHKKYLELLKQDNVELDFEIATVEFDNHSKENMSNAKHSILNTCETLMNFLKSDTFFSAKLSKDEIDKLIPSYFATIKDISNTQRALYSEAIVVSRKINELERIHTEVAQKYSDFLPYKAAFGKNEKYQDEILHIDNEFKATLEKTVEQKKALANELSQISTICDELIPSFFKRSSQAADTPRFKNFNDAKFFNSVSSFMEQIKSI